MALLIVTPEGRIGRWRHMIWRKSVVQWLRATALLQAKITARPLTMQSPLPMGGREVFMSRISLQRLPSIVCLTLLLALTAPAANARGNAAATGSTTAAPKTAVATVVALPTGMQRVTSVEGITEYSLPNGLRVLLFPDASKETTTVNVTYTVGSRHEGYGEAGMAHLLEHMVFKGTPKHPDIPQELTAHGARPNGSTSFDRTNYYESFTATEENLDWALELESDRMVNSNIAKQDLDSEFTVVRNEFEIGENDPQGVLLERLMSTAFLWHNYGKSTIGSRSDIERVPIERLKAFYRLWYRPSNALLVVAGKFDEARTLAKIAQLFGPIVNPSEPLPSTYTTEPAQDGEREAILRRVGDVQKIGAIYHVPAGSHIDFPAVEVAGFILGDDPSGRLYKALVETKLATSVYAGPWQLHDPGVLVAGAEVRKEQSLPEVRDRLLKVVEEFGENPPSVEEVERARQNLLTDWDTAMRDSEWAAINLSEWSALGDWRLMFVHRDRLKTVQPSDVQRVAKAFLRRENRTAGMFIPSDKPSRAEVPDRPDVAAIVRDYKGGEPLVAGEVFDSSPAAIEARTVRAKIAPGIKLVMLPKKTRGGTVNLSMSFHFGDQESLQGRTTVGSMTGSMLMRGSAKHSRQQLQDELARLQSQLYVGGGSTGAGVSIEAKREKLQATLRLAAEVLRQPSFQAAELELLRQERLASQEERKTDPSSLAYVRLGKHLNQWPKGDPRYVENADEAMEALEAVTLDDLKQFHADFYGASAAEISVVGDFDPKQVQSWLTELFGGWKNSKPFKRLASPYVAHAAIDERIPVEDKESAVFSAGLVLKLRDDSPDYPALVLGEFMIGGGFLNSRLATRIRRTDGLSYGVGSYFYASSEDETGYFGAGAIYAPQNADKLVAAFREELLKVLDKGFLPKEIAEAKQGWLQEKRVSRANDGELVGALAGNEYLGRTLAWDAALEQKIAALTNEQIVTALRKHIDVAKISIVQSGSFK